MNVDLGLSHPAAAPREAAPVQPIATAAAVPGASADDTAWFMKITQPLENCAVPDPEFFSFGRPPVSVPVSCGTPYRTWHADPAVSTPQPVGNVSERSQPSPTTLPQAHVDATPLAPHVLRVDAPPSPPVAKRRRLKLDAEAAPPAAAGRTDVMPVSPVAAPARNTHTPLADDAQRPLAAAANGPGHGSPGGQAANPPVAEEAPAPAMPAANPVALHQQLQGRAEVDAPDQEELKPANAPSDGPNTAFV